MPRTESIPRALRQVRFQEVVPELAGVYVCSAPYARRQNRFSLKEPIIISARGLRTTTTRGSM